MYKKILAPLDGSELSECILDHLKAVANGCHVPEVVLLRVVEPLLQISEASDEHIRESRERALQLARDYLSGVAEKLRKEGINASVAVLEGMPAEKILDYIKGNNVDLVVMGTHGRSGIARWTMGSVADRIVRHSGAPILVIAPAGCRV
jgi:nucleotide-binding universal stress UspA family protein